jgi:hypothetical protein
MSGDDRTNSPIAIGGNASKPLATTSRRQPTAFFTEMTDDAHGGAKLLPSGCAVLRRAAAFPDHTFALQVTILKVGRPFSLHQLDAI